jgi:hypothetical protein
MSTIFNIADQLFSIIPSGFRSAAAVLLLGLFLFSVIKIVKKNWFFLLLAFLLIPGAWSALKILLYQLLAIIGFFVYRI